MNYHFTLKILFDLVFLTFLIAFNGPGSSVAEDVFLGGSCNPTTWRTDIVIPEFKKLGITYYNPQVENLNSSLIEAENTAKATATILFFVLDKQTRAVASIVEVAYLAAAQRRIVLVLDQFSKTDCKIGINVAECESLANGRLFLRGIVENIQKLPASNDIYKGIETTAIALGKKTGEVKFQGSKPKRGKDKRIFIVGVASKPTSKALADVEFEWSKGQGIMSDDENFLESKVLLFVIDKNSVDIRVMVMAAYYMGLGFNVVLFLQALDHKNQTYKKDYNRARAYLKDAAEQLCVTIHKRSLEEAYKCAVAKVNELCKGETKDCCVETKDPGSVIPSADGDDDSGAESNNSRLGAMIGIGVGVILIVAVLAYMSVGRGRRRGGRRTDAFSRISSISTGKVRSRSSRSSRSSSSTGKRKSSHS